MAQDLPYSVVSGKIPDLLKKIADAKIPDSFSHAFLRDTLGFKSNNDRNLIALLKALGLLDSSGKPTGRYRELKNNSSKGNAIATGIKEAYAPLFDANEAAHTLQNDELKGLIAQVSGADKEMTNRIYYTLNTLIKEANFSAPLPTTTELPSIPIPSEAIDKDEPIKVVKSGLPPELTTQFHFNIQVHLPNNGTEETYLNIFNALREAFQ